MQKGLIIKRKKDYGTEKSKLFLFFAAILFISSISLYAATPVQAQISENTSIKDSYSANVLDISGKKYYPALKQAIEGAEDSIYMVMFQVSLNPYNKTSQVYKLVDELLKAHKRGVNVKVILDQNVDFVNLKSIDKWVSEGKNAWCFKMLKEAGVDVYYDNLTTYTHAKAIVIDKEIVMMGSANWSENALNKNIETNVLIKSRELANEILEYFNKIEIDEKVNIPILKNSIPVSWKFLENPKLAGRMLTKRDERAFDIYLLLLREFDGSSKSEIILNYEKIADDLGLLDRMTKTDYRRQIIKSLRKLEDTYKLIRFEPEYGKNAAITLLSYDNPGEIYTTPKEWYFQVPDNFWEYGWSRKLSMRAKFCYLINLAYESISNAKPWWFSSGDVLSDRFNVSKWVISKGMQELRRENLIDVAYDSPKGNSYKTLLAKSYKVLPLYSPEWLDAEWDRLELVYGIKSLNRAREYAKIVFKENDSQTVEDIIIMMESFGREPVKKVFGIVAKKSTSNPKKSYAYVKGILSRMEE
jgi:cardiolipin synthase